MLSKKQIKYLRGLANTLDAKYQIGKNEITDSTIELLDNALTAHELIKISLNKSVTDVKETSNLGYDLGMDSLDVMELGMEVQDEFKIEITDEELAKGLSYLPKMD